MKRHTQHPRRSSRCTPPPARGRLSRLRGDGDVDLNHAHVRAGGDEGYVLALTAILILPLLAVVGLAVDVGAWLAKSSVVQRTADSAAMAGVVWLPDTARAKSAAEATAKANGYANGSGIIVTAVQGSQDTDYQVTVSAPAPRLLSQMFGLKSFNIARTGVARFNKPIPLGSPTNRFGNDMDSNGDGVADCPQSQPAPFATAPCPTVSLLWSAVNSPYSDYRNGDPYTTKCLPTDSLNATDCDRPAYPNGASNPLYKPEGYSYAIDVGAADVGKTISLQVYDAGQFDRTLGTNGGGNTYDCNKGAKPFDAAPYAGNSAFTALSCQTGDWGALAPLEFKLYDNDGLDLTVNYTSVLQRTYIPRNASAATYKNRWATVATFTASKVGIYPFRVRNSGGNDPIRKTDGSVDADSNTGGGSGSNAFALKATVNTGTNNSRLYALDNMSVLTNTPGSTARFYLAEVKPENKGKKLQIDLYDPGDGGGSSDYKIQVLAPAAGAPAVVPTGGTALTDCKYNLTPSPLKGPDTPDTAPGCTIKTHTGGVAGGIYNGGWLRIEIQLAANYTCSSDCWWTIKYDFGSTGGFPTDRTVWSINVIGDPVHLIG